MIRASAHGRHWTLLEGEGGIGEGSGTLYRREGPGHRIGDKVTGKGPGILTVSRYISQISGKTKASKVDM